MIDEFREWKSKQETNPEEILSFLNENTFTIDDLVADLVNLEQRVSKLEEEND